MGRVTAALFAKEGAKVVVADCIDGGEETARMIKEQGGKAVFVKTDVSQSSEVERMVRTAVDTYGKLNVLFNCAGILDRERVPVHACKEEDFNRVIAVNLRGVFLGMKYAIPEMIKAGGGSIINQGSTTCVQGNPGLPSYSTSKGGVATLSMATAVDYLRQNIRVNWTIPGVIATEMIKQGWAQGDEEAVKELEKGQPLGRFGTEEEIANLILFLASDESSYITATGIKIDGAVTQAVG